MSGKKGITNSRGMRGRKRGGFASKGDGLDRSAPDTMASLADQWLEHMRQRNYSPRTVQLYNEGNRSFLRWCQERGITTPRQVTRPILQSFQKHLHRYRKPDGEPIAVSTQRKRLGILKCFFEHLCRIDYLPANPASSLELPRKPRRGLPKALSQEDIKTLMSIPDITDPLGIRDRAILETFYATGARRTELARLRVQDLDLSRQTLLIHKGKGGKTRLVPVGKTALHWLQQYLDITRPLLAIDDEEKALFLSGYGTGFNPTYIGNWVARTLKNAGLVEQGSCHLLRHSCATHMLENGADIRLIQQLLGHESLDTTSIYTEVAIKHLREVYNQTHPSATG